MGINDWSMCVGTGMRREERSKWVCTAIFSAEKEVLASSYIAWFAHRKSGTSVSQSTLHCISKSAKGKRGELKCCEPSCRACTDDHAPGCLAHRRRPRMLPSVIVHDSVNLIMMIGCGRRIHHGAYGSRSMYLAAHRFPYWFALVRTIP